MIFLFVSQSQENRALQPARQKDKKPFCGFGTHRHAGVVSGDVFCEVERKGRNPNGKNYQEVTLKSAKKRDPRFCGGFD